MMEIVVESVKYRSIALERYLTLYTLYFILEASASLNYAFQLSLRAMVRLKMRAPGFESGSRVK